MSSWPPEQPGNPFGDERRFGQFEPETRPGCRGVWFVLFGGGLVAIVMCGLVWYLARLNQAPTIPLEPENSLAEETAETVAAFTSEEVGIEEAELKDIRALFASVERAARAEDSEAFRALVDFDRLYARVKRKARGVDWLTLFQVRQDLRGGTHVLDLWLRCRVRYVQRGQHPDVAIAYTHIFDAEGGVLDYRWWLIRRDGSWRIADWKRIDLGMSESEEWALIAKYYDDVRINGFYDADNDIVAAERQLQEGNTAAARQQLRRAEGHSVLPEYQDRHWTCLGYSWYRCGDLEEALRCHRRVAQPDATPGAYVGQAFCQFDLGNYEETLDLLLKYEAAVGPMPDACRTKAQALEQLGRGQEAGDAWRDVLRGNPDDAYALNSLRLTLDEDEKGQLAEYLARCQDPLESARVVVENSFYSEDRTSLRVIADFLREQFPDSALGAFVAGRGEQISGNYEVAGGFFRQAVEKERDATQATEYLETYLDAMLDADKPLEGYRAAPDARDAFRQLMSGYFEAGLLTPDETRSVIAAHRERAPEDPWLHFYTGILLKEDERYAEAAESFAEGIAALSENDEAMSRFRNERALALLELGRCLEAYRTIPPPDERFGQLAQSCKAAEKYDDLRTLVDAHAEEHPDDARLPYYRAALLVADGQPDEAESLLRDFPLEGDSYLSYAARSMRMELIAGLARWPELYQQAEDAEMFFDGLADEFRYRRDWESLKSLIALHRNRRPDDPNTVYRQVEMYWAQERYAEIADSQALILGDFAGQEDSAWRLSIAGEWLVRSLLKTGHEEDALSAAALLRERDESLLPLILCHVVRGDVAKTRELMAVYQDVEGAIFDLYDDNLAGPLLRSESFVALREDYPLELPLDFEVGKTVLLFREPTALDTGRIEALLQPFFAASLSVGELPSVEPGVRHVAVGDGRLSVCLSQGSTPVACRRSATQSVGARPPVLPEHRGWLAVRGISWARQADDPESRRLVFRVAEALSENNCVGVYLTGSERLLPFDQPTRDLLAGRVPLDTRFQLGEPALLYRDDGLLDDPRSDRKFERRLKEFTGAFETQGPGWSFQARVVLPVGDAHELVWMEVDELDQDYGYSRFTGTLVTDALLVPDLHAGVRLLVEESEINAWRYTGDEGMQQYHHPQSR